MGWENIGNLQPAGGRLRVVLTYDCIVGTAFSSTSLKQALEEQPAIVSVENIDFAFPWSDPSRGTAYAIIQPSPGVLVSDVRNAALTGLNVANGRKTFPCSDLDVAAIEVEAQGNDGWVPSIPPSTTAVLTTGALAIIATVALVIFLNIKGILT